MKTLVLSMISIAATIAAMTACTSESDPINDITNPKDAKVEIKLNAGVVNVETKTAINQQEGISQFINQEIPLFRMNATTDPNWADVEASVNATINGTTVTLNDAQKYYDGSNNAYFIGYFSDIANPTKNANVISFTSVDGTKDIICTDQINAGSNISPETDAKLIFKHMLAKIAIKVKGSTSSQNAFGKITQIELLNIPTALDLTLNKTATISANNPSPTNQTIILYEDNIGKEISTATDGEAIGAIPMIYNGGTPGYGSSASKPLTIKVYTEKNVDGIEIPIESITGGLLNGTKHTITLTFKDKISISSEITGWDDNGNSGAGDVG